MHRLLYFPSGSSGLTFGNLHGINDPVTDLDGHRHRPAAHLTIDDEFGAAFRLIESQREGLATMRAIDGHGVRHTRKMSPNREKTTRGKMPPRDPLVVTRVVISPLTF